MRILAIGDFHGKFPSKILKRVNKEHFDLIVSPGDFCYDRELDRLYFKYVYGSSIALSSFIGKRKNDLLESRSLNAGFSVMKKLNSLGKPIIAVTGNWDPVDFEEIGMPEFKDPNSKRFKDFTNKLRVKIIDFKGTKYSGVAFAGYPRSTYPGKPRTGFNKVNADNKRYFKIFRKLVNEDTIFVSHNCPYQTTLDKIKKRKVQRGEHYGSYLAKKIIVELKPRLVICGHMHENQGMQKIGRTLVVNTGAAYENKAALIDIGKKISVRFIR
jgi:Icc-related predicted phosphoesterase